MLDRETDETSRIPSLLFLHRVWKPSIAFCTAAVQTSTLLPIRVMMVLERVICSQEAWAQPSLGQIIMNMGKLLESRAFISSYAELRW